jgi:hypothetical protein
MACIEVPDLKKTKYSPPEDIKKYVDDYNSEYLLTATERIARIRESLTKIAPFIPV